MIGLWQSTMVSGVTVSGNEVLQLAAITIQFLINSFLLILSLSLSLFLSFFLSFAFIGTAIESIVKLP